MALSKLLVILGFSFAAQAMARDVVVAVVDTGLDTSDSSFKYNLWINPGETGTDANGKDKATNGIDDDGNGFADDVHGWDFVTGSNRAVDHHGHGTHIAGIILQGQPLSANTVAGGRMRLMILKYFDPSPENKTVENSRKALRYAIDQSVDIINYSGGGSMVDPIERNLLEEARRKGILVVAAAGNEGANLAMKPYYPASYDLENILAVAAMDGQGRLLPSSNYGLKVSIAAPGFEVLSTIPGGLFGRMTGTSQATAFVSAVAANLSLQFQARPSVSFLKQQVLQQKIPLEGLKGKVHTAAKLKWPLFGIASYE